MQNLKIVILGNGIAGATAARFLRKRSDADIVMISDESRLPFSRTALMYVYMGHLREEATYLYEADFWDKNRIRCVFGRVVRIDTAAQQLALADGQTIGYDRLILATGSLPNTYGWPGQQLDGVQGLYHLQDLRAMERASARLTGGRRAVVVGGGLIGIEMAEMLHSRRIPVSFLVREARFAPGLLPPEESEMIAREIREHGIDLRLGTELDTILDDGEGCVGGVTTRQGERLDCAFVGLATGVRPNVDVVRSSGIECDQGILVDEYLATSAPGIYAVGDCAQLRRPAPGRRPTEAVWYTARMMGQTVAATICGEKTAYQPRLWFNSAKFFNIEYQVYGHVGGNPPERAASLYWQHPGGKKSIRIQYDAHSRAVSGFLLLGIRYRHEVCERWIMEQASLTDVLPSLALANFDPEFYPQYEPQLLAEYRRQTGIVLRPETRRSADWVRYFRTAKKSGT